MKPSPLSYRRPAGLEEALASLAEESGAKVLAGGQSLVPLLSMRLAAPPVLVDINALPGLDHVRSGPDGVRVGALARHSAVLADVEAARVQPLLGMALARVAHPTIRNRGTSVGSLVHADAAAELPAVLLLLGGSVDAASVRGRRTVAAHELYLGPLETSLAHDELAVEAFFPALAPGEGVAFEEIARRHGDYAMCGVAALVRLERGRVAQARAAFLSVNDVPVVVDLTEVLDDVVDDPDPDSAPDPEALAAAGELALAALDPPGDIHASAAYRAQLVRVLTARVLGSAYADARRRRQQEEGQR